MKSFSRLSISSVVIFTKNNEDYLEKYFRLSFSAFENFLKRTTTLFQNPTKAKIGLFIELAITTGKASLIFQIPSSRSINLNPITHSYVQNKIYKTYQGSIKLNAIFFSS